MKRLGLVGRTLGAILLAYVITAPATAQESKDKKPSLSLEGSAEILYTNMYLAAIGFPLLGDAAAQTTVSMSIAENLLRDGDSVSGFFWGNLGEGDEGPDEYDLGIGYCAPLVGNLSGCVGYQQWNYPDDILAEKPDKTMNYSATYGGDISVYVDAKHRINEGISAKEFLFATGVNMSHALGANSQWNLSGDVSYSRAHNFFGFLNGSLGVKAKVELGYDMKNATLFAGGVRWETLGEHEVFGMTNEDQTQVFGGVRFNWDRLLPAR